MLVLYGAPLAFGLLAIGMVSASSEQIALIRPTQNGIVSIHPAKTSAAYRWQRNSSYRIENACAEHLFKLPLLDDGSRPLCHMRLAKDLDPDAISYYTLRRVEHLRNR